MSEYRDRKDATSRYMLAAIILNSDAVQSAIRRDVRRVSDLLVDEATIEKVLREQVIKREAIDGELYQAAVRRLKRSTDRASRKADTGEVANVSQAESGLTTAQTSLPSSG